MGATLVLPLAAFILLFLIFGISAIRKARKAAKEDATLPVDPYERRQEEKRRLKVEHAEADPDRTQHPARRP
jgi:hypothetical protein